MAAFDSSSLGPSDRLSCAIAAGVARPAAQLSCLGWVHCARISAFSRAKSSFGDTKPPSATSLPLIAYPFAADAARLYPIQSRTPRGLRCRPEYSTTIRAFDPRGISWWRRNRHGSRLPTRCLNWIERLSTPFEIACAETYPRSMLPSKQRTPITRTASCSCGQLTATVSEEPVRISICHCLACQRRTGSVFGAQARFRREGVEIKGISSTYVRVGDSGNSVTFHFCPTCGAIVHYGIAGREEHVAIPVGAFADPDFPQPAFSVYEDDDARAYHL